MNPWDWAGLAASVIVLAAYAAAVAIRARYRRRRPRLRDLADLTRGDVDPDWEATRKTLREPRK